MSDRDVSQAAARWALAQVGSTYSQAKRLREGIFDCSSLVARAYSAQGKRWRYGGNVPTSNYEVYDDDFELLWPASYAEIGKILGGESAISLAKQSGDLQFLCTDSDTSRANRITHVAMVASADRIVHARGTKYGVRTDSIDLYHGKVCAVIRYQPSCTLRSGMKGYRTLSLQQALNRRNADILEDGEYGGETQSALRLFQKSMGIEETGVADEATLKALGQDETADGTSPTVTPSEPLRNAVRITGDAVYVRTGPGMQFEWVSIARKDNVFDLADADGWFPILLNGDVCWVSGKYAALDSTFQ